MYIFWFSASTPTSSHSDPGAIRATAQMWRCSKIMHFLRDLHPTLLSALEGVVDQVHIHVVKLYTTVRDLLPTLLSALERVVVWIHVPILRLCTF